MAVVWAFAHTHTEAHFLDCESTEPASFLVVSLYLSLWRALEAVVSIADPVCLDDPDWAKAEPAKDFWILEAFGFWRVSPAKLATPAEVFLPLLLM